MIFSNKSLHIIIIFLIIVAVFLCFPITASADTMCAICGEPHFPSLSGTAGMAYDMNQTVYGGKLFDSSSGGALTTQDVLSFDTSSSHFSGLWRSVETYYNAVMVLGELLCVVYALATLLDWSTDDNLNPEKFALILIKMCIGMLVIKNGFDIITVATQFATVVFNKIAATPGSSTSKNCNYDTVKDMGFFPALGQVFSLLLPFLAMSAAKLIISIVCWARLIDISIRTIFAPIGIADFVYEGIEGHGFVYVKKLTASAMQAAVIFAIVRAYNLIINSLPDPSSFLIIVFAFAIVLAVIKSSQLTSDVMGT